MFHNTSWVFRGGRPRGLRWAIYLLGSILGSVFTGLAANNCYLTTPPEYINNSLKILRHSGFIVDGDFVHGGVSTDSRIIIYQWVHGCSHIGYVHFPAVGLCYWLWLATRSSFTQP